jgi:Fe-S-cluster-containing dehydrogenase component
MQYGFLIDHDRCIGCHACTVACKSENSVPVGNFRTWVKYTEHGRFPEVKRHFAVLRCNHCTKAPCVTICPVNALEKRADGIVDIDRDACIGCRACMQACPYDAIYLNEDLGAVEKCHFCAHRVEKGLEPACAVVCPENAIIAGDLHDPESTISKLVKANDTLVRRPEQRTGPNVHYVGALPESLQPGEAQRPQMFLWSDRPNRKPEAWPISLPVLPDTRTVLDTEHKVEWGAGVAAYLVTKGVAAGVMMLAPFFGLFGVEGFVADYLPELIALLFIGITGALLVEDLYKPLAFIRLFTRPNWKSWLVKGAWVINVFVAVVAGSLALRWLGLNAAADALRLAGAACGVGVAGYTAFLFAQCEGRDLWQSKWLLPHLLVQAVMCGACVLLASGPPFWWFYQSEFEHDAERIAAKELGWARLILFIIPVFLHLALAEWEARGRHATANARQGAAFMRIVRVLNYPSLQVSSGLLMTAIAAAVIAPWLAWIPAIAGLYLYEHTYIRAGQLPPLS